MSSVQVAQTFQKIMVLEGLQDRPRTGQPKKLSEKVIKEVLRLSVGCIPKEATHWSVHLMANGRVPYQAFIDGLPKNESKKNETKEAA